MIRSLSMVALVAMTAGACGGSSQGSDGAESDEEVAESSEALTNIDQCATGTTANAVANISNSGTSDAYTHLWQYIDTICGPDGRGTTIVDFIAHPSQVDRYHFVVNPTWWTPTTPAQCFGLTMATRVQRRNTSSGAWEDVKYLEQSGFWNPSTNACAKPQFSWDRVNTDGSGTETNKYRVRTWALQWDGISHATVQIIGANMGPP